MRIRTVLATIICCFIMQAPVFAQQEKILQIDLTTTGTIMSAGDTIAADKLANYVKDRLFKSWAGNGKTYTKIKLTGADQVMTLVKDGVIEEIKSGQNLALIAFCLELYRTEFSNLDPKKQEKFKVKFPVLFQSSYF